MEIAQIYPALAVYTRAGMRVGLSTRPANTWSARGTSQALGASQWWGAIAGSWDQGNGGDMAHLSLRARRWGAGILASLVVLALVVGLALKFTNSAHAQIPVNGAAFTTTNTNVDGTGHCKNGNENVNCNIYDGKQYVWLNGGPSVAYVGDGSYFFAVLDPGGQAAPNDGSANNLSSPYDAYTNRTFSVTGGVVSYSGTHDFDSNKIRLMTYDDTSNPGGVYILAICSLANGYPVKPSSCKYDAFKVKSGEVIQGDPLTITKDANGSYKNSYTWQITKDVDKTVVKQVGGSATFNYTVTVTHDGGAISDVKVTGVIDVFNPNVDSNNNTVAVTIDGVSDQLSDGTVCAVSNGGSQALTAADTKFDYSCDLTGLPQGELDNTATVTWSQQFLDNGASLDAGSADFTFSNIAFAETTVDDCVAVSDTFGGSLGTACVGDANPTTYTYARTVSVPQWNCVTYDNTASFTTNTTGTTGSASQTVKVCGPAHTGALTMGFWQNKNGQGIITGGASTAGVCNSATWLRMYAPFQDLSATATCKQVAAYVTTIIKNANASGSSMNAMLKAQMLATALDVYFSDPGLGGNQIGAFNGLGASQQPVGGFSIDLTMICAPISGSSCGGYINASSAFGGATSLTVSQMLAYAGSQSNAGGGTWYGNVKAVQELAKDSFDAVNNQVAFAP